MALFDAKNFNGEVFGAYVDRVPNLNRNELLKSGAVVEAPKYASMLPDQVGGNYITVPIKARIGGTASNYDGNTNIGTSSRKTYTQGRVVVGRANGWVEKDFSADISGEDFMPAAEEVAEYWDDVDQNTILAEMKGIFAMTGKENLKFVEGHTYDISKNSGDAGKFGETTLNTALQKALGDHKAKFSLAITHSAVATNLENMNLIGYAKYTDEQGIQRDVTLVTLNGRLLLIDDNMPTTEVAPVYAASTDTSVQTGKTYYTKSGTTYTPVAAPTGDPSTSSYYEMTAEGYTEYTTYAFGDGAIEYTNCGAIDSNGNALFSVLTAHGINADWVRVGGLGNGDGQIVVKNAAGDTVILLNNAGITMADGTSLINASGVCGDLTFSSGGTPFDLGWAGNVIISAESMVKREVFLQAMIPENYVITSAVLIVSACGTAWENIMDAGSSGSPSYSSCNGYSRGIKAYVGAGQIYKSASWDGEYTYASAGTFTQIVSGGFTEAGVNGTSGTTPKQIKSNDIKSMLSSGLNTIKITVDDFSGTTNRSYAIRTGSATALLNVKGYTKN